MPDQPTPYELHTIIEHLKDEARKDRDCGWPRKAAKKEQAAELLRRLPNDQQKGCA